MPLLETLLALQAHIEKHGEPPLKDKGICHNLLKFSHQNLYCITQLFAVFEALGLKRCEPIPKYTWHESRGSLWKGKQRELRLNLLQNLVNYYQEQN